MDSYSFWQDFFISYRASPDAIKALWLTMPPAFVLMLAWVFSKPAKPRISGKNKTGEASQPAGQLPVSDGDA
ncbi:MAG: hypothetical protein M9924_07275 [Rhizobiaceae bacterium]|nr:hypothetical protein [Rhizobiaceae bacterium]